MVATRFSSQSCIGKKQKLLVRICTVYPRAQKTADAADFAWGVLRGNWQTEKEQQRNAENI